MIKVLPVFIFFLVAASCASQTDFDRLRSEMHELRSESQETRSSVDTLKVSTAKEDTIASLRESLTNLNARTNELARGLQELRGRHDEQRYFIEKALKEQRAELDLLKAQIAGLEAQNKEIRQKLALLGAAGGALPAETASDSSKGESPNKPAQTQSQPTSAEKGKGPSESKAVYDAAYKAFQEKKYRDAREQFEAFLKRYPDDALSDNAQFWIAESYYAEREFENAILSYETLMKKHPASGKVPGAMLKQALAFIEIGDAKTARIILNRLTEKYPDSQEAGAAKKKLTELNKAPTRKK